MWVSDEENTYVDVDGKQKQFESLMTVQHASVELSVIVPAYNEEKRLPIMLNEALEYLDSRVEKDSTFSYEIIIVDDGSKDKTKEVGWDYAKRQKNKNNQIRVLSLKKNRGKGGAVKRV